MYVNLLLWGFAKVAVCGLAGALHGLQNHSCALQ
jgi:hypothetical protein